MDEISLKDFVTSFGTRNGCTMADLIKQVGTHDLHVKGLNDLLSRMQAEDKIQIIDNFVFVKKKPRQKIGHNGGEINA